MKLFSSFIKELKLASRGFYFYIELFMALLILLVVLFLVPDHFTNQSSEYIYLDMPTEAATAYLEGIEDQLENLKIEETTLTIDDKEEEVSLYQTEEEKIYFLNNREDVNYMADVERKVAAVIQLNEDGTLNYEYYLQGYESDKYKNLLKILHLEATEKIEKTIDSQEVRPLSADVKRLTDKENLLPTILVFNGALMGLFIIAAYIFLDRQEGVIKALAISPLPVWQYLVSKLGVVLLTSLVSSIIVLLPIMQFKPNYLSLVGLLLAAGFFSSALGLFVASFYENIMQAFGTLYGVMLLMILPNIAYFMPSWNPSWIKLIPSYHMLEGFKSTLLGMNDWPYTLTITSGFLVFGLILFTLSTIRYKKHLA